MDAATRLQPTHSSLSAQSLDFDQRNSVVRAHANGMDPSTTHEGLYGIDRGNTEQARGLGRGQHQLTVKRLQKMIQPVNDDGGLPFLRLATRLLQLMPKLS